MNLEFLSLTVRNFGSFIQEQTFNFSDREFGVYFIKGDNRLNPRISPNGSGKSTFFVNALCWVLTGRTSRGLRSTDVKPWRLPKGKRDNKTVVSLTFTVDGNKHELVRVAPNAITLDGNEVSQEHVDKLTRLSYSILKQTVIFGQHEQLFFDLSNKDKLAVLSEVLELDKWEVRSQKASERVRTLETKLTSCQTQLTGLRASLRSTEELIEGTTAASKRWKAERTERISRAKEKLKSLANEERAVKKQRDTAVRIAKAAAEKLGEREGEIQVHMDRLRSTDKEYTKLSEQKRYLERQIRDLDRELDELGSADTCPTCGQPITGTDLGKHKKELTAKRAKLVKEINGLELEKYSRAVDSIKEKMSSIRATLAGQQATVEAKKREADHCTRCLIEISATVAKLKEQIEERRDETNPHIEQLKKLRSNLAETEGSIAQVEHTLKKTEQRIERAKFWIKGFKDVRLFIIEEVLQELELSTNAALSDLGLDDWSVKYDIERETKSGTLQTGLIITILSPQNDNPVRWELWSGGEGQRLRLAGSMALSEVLLNSAGLTVDLEIFDEPTKHMNAAGVEDFYDMLAERAKDLKRRIFIVDHTVVESSAFADSITVVVDHEGSHIEET